MMKDYYQYVVLLFSRCNLWVVVGILLFYFIKFVVIVCSSFYLVSQIPAE